MNRSRARGTAFESALVAYLNDHGFPHAERRALRGTDDRGDVAGIVGWVLEAKACKAITLGEWMNELAAEKKNAGASFGAVVAKRRQKPVDQAYVVMTLADFARLVADDPAA